MINFYKERNFESLFSDTFRFIRQEFKPFLTTILKITGPWLVLLLIGYVGYSYSMGDFLDNVLATYEEVTPIQGIVSIIVMIVGAVGAYVLAQASVLYYIDSYNRNEGIAVFEEVSRNAYQYFFSFWGLGFVSGILFIIGFVFCIIPGIYLWVPLTLSFPVLAFQKKGVFESVGYTFTLIKDEWWNSFGFLFVLVLLLSIAGSAFSIPTIIYSFAKMFTGGELDPENIANLSKDYIYITLNTLGLVLQFVLNFASIVGGAFLYFSLQEKNTQTGTLSEIDKLGS
ncbi:MAG: hypothetical protein RQ735_10785 [Flavobacteriaceae bacterium]|nr:hypothetical protein [Flavobacteriaceae bacterium]